jgi:hypothetical protein
VYVGEEEETSVLAVKPTVNPIQFIYCKFYSCSCAICKWENYQHAIKMWSSFSFSCKNK